MAKGKNNWRGWTEDKIKELMAKGTVQGYKVVTPPLNKLPEALQQMGKKKRRKSKRMKYNNERVFYDGRWFDSIKECERYKVLLWRQKHGEIGQLRCQVPYELRVNGVLVSLYIADFVYIDLKLGEVVEDVKSSATKNLPAFRKNKALMKAILNIDIQII